MAQLVAHLLCKQGVTGSSPVSSTQYPLAVRLRRIFLCPRRRRLGGAGVLWAPGQRTAALSRYGDGLRDPAAEAGSLSVGAGVVVATADTGALWAHT